MEHQLPKCKGATEEDIVTTCFRTFCFVPSTRSSWLDEKGELMTDSASYRARLEQGPSRCIYLYHRDSGASCVGCRETVGGTMDSGRNALPHPEAEICVC